MTQADLSIHPAARPARAGAWVLVSPLVGWLAVFVVVPTALMVVYSFCDRTELGEVVFDFTWDNWARLLPASAARGIGWGLLAGGAMAVAGSPRFAFLLGWAVTWGLISCDDVEPGALLNFMRAVHYAAASTGICVVLGYPVAYFIAKTRRSWRGPLLLAVMIPFWTSFLIRIYAWVIILSEQGLLNSTLLAWHVIDTPLRWLNSPVAVMIGMVYTYLPFMILPLYGNIERLDDALIEAALDLGASPLRAFARVILPLTRPGIVAGVLLVFVPALGMFAINDMLGGRKDPVIGNVIDQQFNTARNPPFGATLGVLLTVMFVGIYFIATRRKASVIGH